MASRTKEKLAIGKLLTRRNWVSTTTKTWFKGLGLSVPDSVYGPAEDTGLLLRNFKPRPFTRVLDMGTGSGVLAIAASKQKAFVTAVDVNPEAVETAKRNAIENGAKNITFVHSDLFERVAGTYDYILFNPPYLPEDGSTKKWTDPRWSGGEDGLKVIEQFAKNAKKFLKPGGKVFLVASSLSGYDKIVTALKKGGFAVRLTDQEKMAWETLYLLELS